MSIHIRLLNIAIAINSGYLYEQSIRTKAPAALAAAERHYRRAGGALKYYAKTGWIGNVIFYPAKW